MKFNQAIIVLCMANAVHANQQAGDDKTDIVKNFQATLRRLEKEIAVVRRPGIRDPRSGQDHPAPG